MERKIVSKRQQIRKKNPSTVKKAANTERWKYYVPLAIILLLTFIVYFPVLNNEFLNWDDNNYIKYNPLVHYVNLKEIFSHNVMSNYHPLTILTLAIEYQFFGLNATGYHAFNLFLHLLNVILVFYAANLLSNKVGVALVVSLLFGIHPIHVESVAWAAELKDLLYTFFFLISYILYLNYLKDLKRKYYVFALLVFFVSLLSKAMAASLPAILVLTDYFKGRPMNMKAWLEKAPFFLLALIFGLVAVSAQQTAGATDMVSFPFMQRLVFICYGFITYLLKLIFPMNLSAYYPYPIKSGDDIPIQFFVYVFLVLCLAAYLFYSFRLSRKKVVFGIVFFTVTVFLVLQLLPVGGAVMADRYSYIPSIGIFYLAGEGFIYLWSSRLKGLAVAMLSVLVVFFSVKTYARCDVWKNDMTLWNDVISKYQNVPTAYYNRGILFMNEKIYQRALEDYSKAIELNPKYTEAYNNRGTVFTNEKRNAEALNDFTKAIDLKPNYAEAYFNRGIVYTNEKRNAEALSDYTKAIELKPNYAEAYNNRGTVFSNENRTVEALNDYNKAIELKPNYTEAYFNRGNVFKNENRNGEALNDYTKAIELNPKYAEAYFNRGNVFFKEKRYEEAISNYTIAIAIKNDYAQAYYNRGVAEFYSGKKDAACMDVRQSASLGYQPAADALAQICN